MKTPVVRRRPFSPAVCFSSYAAVFAALLSAACGNGDSPSGPQPDARTHGDGGDTEDSGQAADGALPFAPAGPDSSPDPMAIGPFPVGVATVDYVDPGRIDPATGMGRMLRTEIWYPAVQSARGDPPWSYDFKAEAAEPIDLGAKRDEFMAADLPPIVSSAVRDAAIDRTNGPFPVVLFSHGAYSLRFQYLYFTIHLASHGHVVVAPDHAGNTLWDMIRDGQDSEALGRSMEDRPQDLRLVLDQIEAAHGDPASILNNAVDLAHVAACGHSFGGFTAMAEGCFDPRINLVILHAPLVRPIPAMGCAIETYPVPLMLLGGTDDRTLPWPEQVCTYRQIESIEKYLYEVERGGHFTFCDLCTYDFGGATFVEGPDLENDGCSPTGNVPFAEAQKTANHYSTAFANARLRGSPGSAAMLVDRDDMPFDTVNFVVGDNFPAGYDGGCAEADGGVAPDAGGNDDAGVADAGTVDGGVADGGGCGTIPGWPPDQKTDPWYQGRVCRLPVCDEGAANSCHDSSGTWTQKLTTVSHTCGKMAEAFDQRLKPGNVTLIQDVTFNSVGECEYSPDHALVGVVKGATGISCTVGTEPDGLGGTITRMETGVATSYGNYMSGTARVFLFDLPMGTPDCYADFELRFDRN
ncbi:MAG: alpha/beta hydrolase [Deltaproteobacteria bacterium]|nr:alpha/beta hydrolase [Deltaproteobacteria bacterium]